MLPRSFFLNFPVWFAALALITVVGCGTGTEEAVETTETTESSSMESTDEGEPTEGLSAEEQALVEAQIYCPVGGGELGSMGTPVKVMVDGDPIFICCEHCREPLLEEPEKYLAELAELKAKAAAGNSGATEGDEGSGESDSPDAS